MDDSRFSDEQDIFTDSDVEPRLASQERWAPLGAVADSVQSPATEHARSTR